MYACLWTSIYTCLVVCFSLYLCVYFVCADLRHLCLWRCWCRWLQNGWYGAVNCVFTSISISLSSRVCVCVQIQVPKIRTKCEYLMFGSWILNSHKSQTSSGRNRFLDSVQFIALPAFFRFATEILVTLVLRPANGRCPRRFMQIYLASARVPVCMVCIVYMRTMALAIWYT